MKATITFDLPEDKSNHLRAIHADEAWHLIYEMEARLRNLVKYGVSKDSSYEQELMELRKEIGEVTALIGD